MLDLLKTHLPVASFEPASSLDGMPTIYVARAELLDVCRALRDTPELRFAFLADLVPVDHYPRDPRFEVTYLLASLGTGGFGVTPQRLRVRVRVPGRDPRLPTVSGVWPVANWAEREAYDLFGITFEGHPDLRRILMPEDWEGFPLRKDYPVQIKEPVKTYAPLQLSADEFVANVEAARERAHPAAHEARGGDPGTHPTAPTTRGGDPGAHPTAPTTRGGDPGAHPTAPTTRGGDPGAKS